MHWIQTLWRKFAASSTEIKIFIIAVIVMFAALLWLTIHPYFRLPKARSVTEHVTE